MPLVLLRWLTTPNLSHVGKCVNPFHICRKTFHGYATKPFPGTFKNNVLPQRRTVHSISAWYGSVSINGGNFFARRAYSERRIRLCQSLMQLRGLASASHQRQGRQLKGSAGFRNRNQTTAIYVMAVGVTVLGLSYAAVPLYRLYCQATGLGGTVKTAETGEKIEKMERKPERLLKIRFNADTSSTMQWKFRPQQPEVRLVPGETALAFYTATNPTDRPVTGISTYNVIPFDAGQYFNKIQCFCFEEQRLNPHEQVDMPVFFYIDPEFTEDPAMARVDTITLSYTFFEAKEAEQLGL